MSNSKSPYEIRLDLLKMAQDHLTMQYQQNVQFVQEYNNKLSAALPFEEYNAMLPKMPTFDDIMEKATELYGFVNKK